MEGPQESIQKRIRKRQALDSVCLSSWAKFNHINPCQYYGPISGITGRVVQMYGMRVRHSGKHICLFCRFGGQHGTMEGTKRELFHSPLFYWGINLIIKSKPDGWVMWVVLLAFCEPFMDLFDQSQLNRTMTVSVPGKMRLHCICHLI